MDYKKKYNEALERAKTLYENANDMILKKWVEQVFPELKESEDERIRQRIIHALHGDVLEMSEIKEAVAWLEGQKEFVSADFDDVWETADCNELTAPLEKYSKDAIKEMCHAWYDKGIELERKNWLEKQGEHSVSPLFTFEDVLTIQCAMAYAKFQDRELDVALKKLHDKVYDAYHDSKNHHIESQDCLKGEQKPVPKFEVGDVMRTLQESADNITSGLPVVVSIDDEYYRCNNELIAIKDQDDYEYPPMNRMQNHAWSEVDNFMYNKIKNLLTDISLAPESRNSLFDWLESLKDRVQPQPKQEWSKEDEDNFKHLMDEIVCLGNSRNSANRLHYDRLIKFLYELKNRAQPREEWRDKDERMLDRLIAYFEKQVAFTDDDNPRYAKWLESLKPQNTWKPSDEQLKSLKEVIDVGHFTSYPNALETLYEQLKKLREE